MKVFLILSCAILTLFNKEVLLESMKSIKFLYAQFDMAKIKVFSIQPQPQSSYQTIFHFLSVDYPN